MQLILLIILGVIAYLIWKRTMQRLNTIKKAAMKGEPPKEMSELVQDPVCKLYIAKESSIFYKGHHFCSEKCKNEFK